MTINFKSIITLNEKEINRIEFNSMVNIFNEKDWTIYEFSEPSRNVMNRVEIKDEKFVNIIAGPSTLNLELGKDIDIEYSTENGSIYLTSYLISVKTSKNEVKLFYTLKQNEKVLGEYNITLTFSE